MRKTILLLMAVSLPFFILTSCNKDDGDDNGTGKNTHLLKCTDNHHPHAIDLGLPSGTKWACCNVDATTPEGYGGYYAWGETSEKSYYGWDTNKWYSSDCGITKYCTDSYSGNVDGKTVLDLSDDVAHVRLGSPWRMPTVEQIKELADNCTRTWTQRKGVNGFLITGKNGGQIFLPAAGDRWLDGLRDEGYSGGFWSNSLDPNSNGSAYDLYFNSDYWRRYGCDGRCDGRSVRAVCP